MKSLTIVGISLVAVSALLFYLTTDFDVEKLNLSHFMGILGGIGIGLIIGGIFGYISKGNAIKIKEKNKEIQKLQEEIKQQNNDNTTM